MANNDTATAPLICRHARLLCLQHSSSTFPPVSQACCGFQLQLSELSRVHFILHGSAHVAHVEVAFLISHCTGAKRRAMFWVVPLFGGGPPEYCYCVNPSSRGKSGRSDWKHQVVPPSCPPLPLHWLNSMTRIREATCLHCIQTPPLASHNGSGVQTFSSLLEPDPESRRPSYLCNGFSPTRPVMSGGARGEHETVA